MTENLAASRAAGGFPRASRDKFISSLLGFLMLFCGFWAAFGFSSYVLREVQTFAEAGAAAASSRSDVSR
jgi:hypothetical protein